MAVPIADNWKAIHDRLQQIKWEESASHRPCPQCGGRGWMPDYTGAQRAYTVGFAICDICHNSEDLPPPAPEPRKGHGRTTP
jgi:hypothetical protein